MKIHIIEPYDRRRRYDIRSLTPGLGPVTVATMLEEHGHDVEVISEYVTTYDPLTANNADVVGISITTYNAARGFDIARTIDVPVIFGGFHASLMPEECLDYGCYVIRGDGHSVVNLINFIGGGGGSIQDIPNLVYKHGKKVVYNRRESRPVELAPNFNLIKNYDALNLNRLLRIPLLVCASRGCLYQCSFCAIRDVYRDFKKRDIDGIITDIKRQIRNQHPLARFFPRVIWITDDNFFSDGQWAKEVLKEISRINTGYKYTLQARLDIAVDRELLQLLNKAGVHRIYVGIESLEPKSLQNFNKGINAGDIKSAVHRIRAHGIDVYGLFVFGDDAFMPGDGARVAEFAIDNGLSGILVQPLTPYPGTSLYSKLKGEGRILHRRWKDYNGKIVFKPKNMTAANLHKEINDCYRTFYAPRRIFKILTSSQKEFRLGGFGEAIYRNIETRKMNRYVNDYHNELS